MSDKHQAFPCQTIYCNPGGNGSHTGGIAVISRPYNHYPHCSLVKTANKDHMVSMNTLSKQ